MSPSPDSANIPVLDRPQPRKLLKRTVRKEGKSINANDWNYYRSTSESAGKDIPGRCRAIRYIGGNQGAITQPTGLLVEPALLRAEAGSINFRRTSYCPSGTLGLGEYLLWDGTCFTVMAGSEFISLYKPVE